MHIKNVNKIDDYQKYMFKKFSKIGLLLMTLLFVLSFVVSLFSSSVNAAELNYSDGDVVIFSIEKGLSVSYEIKGVYNAGAWDVTSINNILAEGEETNATTLVGALCEAYAKVTKSPDTKELLPAILELVAAGDGSSGWDAVISSSRARGAENKVIIKTSIGTEKFTWGTFTYDDKNISPKSYRDILSDGNPGMLMYNDMEGGSYTDDPLYFPENVYDKQDLKFNDYVLVDQVTDEMMFKIFMSEFSPLPSGVSKAENLAVDDVPIVSSDTYTAEFATVNSHIYIYVRKPDGTIAANFYFGDLVGIDNYRERKYTNEATSSVKVTYKDGVYKLSAEEEPKNLADNKSFYQFCIAGDGGIKYVKNDQYYSALTNSPNTRVNFGNPKFVAMAGDGDGSIVIYSASSAKKRVAELKEEIVLSKSLISSVLKDGSTVITSGDWNFELYKNDIIMAYKVDEENIDENAYYYDFGSLKRMYVKDDKYCDIYVAAKKGKGGTFNYNLPSKKEVPFAVVRASEKPSAKGKDTNYQEITNEFNEYITDPDVSIYAETLSLKNDSDEAKGSEKGNKLKVNDCNTYESDLAYLDYPPPIPLSELLMLIKTEDQTTTQPGSVDVDISAKLGSAKTEVKEAFEEDLIKYGKSVLMFLVFCSIVITGLISIWSGHDAERRVEVMERLKHILIGVVIFAVAIPVFGLIMEFAASSYDELAEIAESYTGPTFYATQTRYETGFIVNFIGSIVDLLTVGINWLVDGVLTNSMRPNEQVTLMQLIYGVTDSDGGISSLAPFTESEWTLYMSGYRLLSSLTMAIMAIALVKLAGDIIISSGNYEKIAATKESAQRIVFAILAVVLSPYGFRLLLLFFNYLTGMLPIDGDTATFDIEFDAAGFVGSVANMMFATVRLRIFILFFVRKVMLAFLLLSSPVVLGIWAISNKFRAANLWVGETLSNASVQFCYAMVFLVVMLITFEGQNPFITLIIVTLIPKFAGFFSSSLEGLAEKWGGINEEAVASQITNGIKNSGKSIKNGVKRFGHTLQNASKFFDSEGVSKTGRNVNNVGAILSGNVTGIRTKNDVISNRVKVAKEQYRKDQKIYNSFKEDKDKIIRVNDDVKNYYEARLHALNDPEAEMPERQEGGGYDVINNYFGARENLNLSKNCYEGYRNIQENHVAEVDNSPVKGGAIGGLGRKIKNSDISRAIRSSVPVNEGIIGTIQHASKNKTAKELNKGYEEKLASEFKKTMEVKTKNSTSDQLSMIIQKMLRMQEQRKNTNNITAKAKSSTENKAMIRDLVQAMGSDKSKSVETLNLCQNIYDNIAVKQIKITGTPDVTMAKTFTEAKEDYQKGLVIPARPSGGARGTGSTGSTGNSDGNAAGQSENTEYNNKEFNREKETRSFNEDPENNDTAQSSPEDDDNFVNSNGRTIDPNMNQVAPGHSMTETGDNATTDSIREKQVKEITEKVNKRKTEYAKVLDKSQKLKEEMSKIEKERKKNVTTNMSTDEAKKQGKAYDEKLAYLKMELDKVNKEKATMFDDISNISGQKMDPKAFDAEITEKYLKEKDGGVYEAKRIDENINSENVMDNGEYKGVAKENIKNISNSENTRNLNIVDSEGKVIKRVETAKSGTQPTNNTTQNN